MRPPKFIPTCDSILIPNVASTLQWKRRRIRRVAWYAEDDFNVNPTSSLSCHVSCADFFRRRALFLPLTRRPWQAHPEDPPPAPVRTFVRWYKCSFVQLYACALLCRTPYYLYLSCSIFFVRILVSCLTLFFLVLLRLFFCFVYPLPMFQHADRTALFQRFVVVCFLNLITPLLVCIVITNNRLGSQPSEFGVTL